MATDTARHTARLASPALLRGPEWPVAVAAGLACVVVTIALTSGGLPGAGAKALGAAIFVLVVLWCLTEQRIGRTLVVFGLYVGLLDGYLKLRTGSRDITLVRDVLLWAIAIGALWRASTRGESLRLPPLGALVVAFVLVVLAEVLNPSAPGLSQTLGGVRQHLEFVPLFFLGYVAVRTPGAVRVLLVTLVVAAAANGAVGYVQSTLTPAQLAGWGAGYKERILGTGIFKGQNKVAFDVVDGVVVATSVRPFGLGSELGAGAVIAALALPGLIALLFTTGGALRLLLVLCSPLVALGVATAGTRAALVACVVSVLAFICIASTSYNVWRVTLGVGVALVLVSLAFGQLGPGNDAQRRASTITPTKILHTFSQERGDSVGKIGDYAVSYPLGLGVGTVGPAAHVLSATAGRLDAETEWNLAVLELGVAGLLILLALSCTLIAVSFTRIRRIGDPHLRLQLAAVAAPLVALLVLGFAGPTTVSAPSGPYLWLAAGVLSFWLLGAGRRSAA